tara:strand:+ start:1410 stop:1868 length:459 start_codon:yes stop_codon:yes gene_type:complete
MTTTIFGKVPDPKVKAEIINKKSSGGVNGVKYPLYDKNNHTKGIFVKTKGFTLLRSEATQLIRTERGERVMLPNYGLSLKKYLFEPLTDDLVESVTEEIFYSFSTYLPKAKVRSVDVRSGDNVHGLGVPGLLIQVVISPANSLETALLEINL